MSSSRRRDFLRGERGQSLVEFAITVPILLILILGIVDFARAWNVYQVLTDAGREGARVAVVDNGSSDAQIRALVKNAAGRAGIGLEDSDVLIAQGIARGEPTTVTIQYTHTLQWISGLFGILGADGTFDFNVVSTMRRE